MNEYYTYAYLREDRTPYYIGKGQGDRIYKKGSGEVNPPKDKSRVIYLKQNLTEEEAFRHEIYMIDVFGRKDLGTGILRNKTNGGEGTSGVIRSDEYRKKMSDANKNPSEETRKKLSDVHRGKIVTEETRRKISDAQKGKTHSKESRRKMSVNKGKKWWNDGCGNVKLMIECPGDGWKPGRR